ncbi:hypothetical protein [Klebsiella oxytoca]|uniref:hypothetical protein n=1 Tax=Klebsiella oxytoca TaxID=571 RepID=UPI0009B6E33D|nr:hypothetical protein [Klebsiella oxytoca]ARB21087.1 hypothetical protein AM394_07605 [Klebsiella oxytoca]MBX4771471.1 hypothetical protein [Klebsiella oxytoca]
MNEKSMEWKETSIKIIATTPETASFISNVIGTYNELIHYMYYSMEDDLFLKIINDGFSVERYIRCVISMTLDEWKEEEKQTKEIHFHEVKIVLTSYHDFVIKCHDENSVIFYYKSVELSHNRQSVF